MRIMPCDRMSIIMKSVSATQVSPIMNPIFASHLPCKIGILTGESSPRPYSIQLWGGGADEIRMRNKPPPD